MLGLRDHLAKLRQVRATIPLRQVNGDQSAALGVQVGPQIERRAVGEHRRELRPYLVDDLDRLAQAALAVRVGDRIDPEPVAVLGALGDRDQQIALVVAELGPEEELVVVGEGQDGLVVGLVVSDPMQPQPWPRQGRHLGTLGATLMIEMGVDVGPPVGQPFGAGELGDHVRIGDRRAGRQIEQVEGRPVATAVRPAVRGIPTGPRDREGAQRAGAVLGERVRVHQHPATGAQLRQGVGDVQHVLVLGAVVAIDEVAAGLPEGHAGPRPGKDGAHGVGEPGPLGKGLEVGLGDLVLAFHPVGGLGGVRILQPAVGISDRASVQHLDEIIAPGLWIVRHNAHRGIPVIHRLLNFSSERSTVTSWNAWSTSRCSVPTGSPMPGARPSTWG